MTVAYVLFDPNAPAGSRFKSTAVQDEIGEVAPKTVDEASITGDKLADLAVTGDKIANGTITSGKIGAGEVNTANLADDSVTNDQIAPGSVTGESAGPGIMTTKDASGNDITLAATRITTTAYAALTVVDPNVLYLVVTG